MNKKCDDEIFPLIEEDPDCYPDIAESWLSNVKTEIALTNTTNGVMCLIDKARKYRDKCNKAPFTKHFVNVAFKEVTEAANLRMNAIKNQATSRQIPAVNPIQFSSGRRSNSTLDALQKALEEEEERNKSGFWVV